MPAPSYASPLRLALAAIVLALAGCASTYIPPGPRADLQAFAPASVQQGFAAKPVAPFPASLAFVRLQGRDYASYNTLRSAPGPATTRFTAITSREVEDDAQIDRLAHLAQISGVTGINHMLLPTDLQGEQQVRDAAARLNADLVLAYTFDTAFFETDLARPLTVITLGLSPTRKVSVTTTASALLIDTRTGYIYSTYETTRRADTHATSWGSRDAADETRRANEREAFGQLVDEIAKSWPKVVERYAHPAAATASAVAAR